MCPVEELPPGEVKIVHAGLISLGVYNLAGDYYAIEDRCSHDDGPLCEGDFDQETGVVICPRHGANFDIRSGRRADAARVRAGGRLPGARRRRDRQSRALSYVGGLGRGARSGI